MTRLVQIIHPEYGRRIALVNGEDELHLLSTYRTAYDFAMAAIETGQKMRDLLSTDLSGIVLDYREVHALRSGWRFLPSFDHPAHTACCLVSGCANAHGSDAPLPAAPPWFTKGNGMHLRAHGEPLTIPAFALSGAEEAELAGVYLIGPDGVPRRVGLTPGNEFADPAMAAKDARLLSRAKLRTCAIGPELALDAEFRDVTGSVTVERSGVPIWFKQIRTGEKHTACRLEQVERHHFEFDPHRIPGDAHIHFLGGSVSSFGDGVVLEEGDEVVIQWEGFGRPLRNPIERERAETRTEGALPL